MRYRRTIRFFVLPLLFLLLTLPTGAAAQQTSERADTEQRLEELQRQIREFEQRLARTRQQEQSATKTLENLDREIQVRQALMNTYSVRIGQLETEEGQIRTSMARLEREVQHLKQQYRDRAVHAYKHGRLHDLALILGSESINQMLVRVKYLRRFAGHRRGQLQEIENVVQQLNRRQAELQGTINRNQQLLQESQQERQNLSRLQRERSNVVSNLRTERTSLQQEIEQKRQDAQRLEARLRQLIAAEAARARAREAADPAAAAAAIELSGSFRENRGRMPWPVQGVVTAPYGPRTHPVYGTRTLNPGLEISTASGAAVNSVFDGVVNQIFVMAGYGTCVTVRHGDFTTVYGNLSGISVQQGQEVRAGQQIGRSGTTNEPLGTTLFFALFTNEAHEDPLPWLVRR